MLKGLEIKNFQSHEHTSLQFSPSINVIVGSSDVGKSAILRALRWVTEGRPLGDSIVRKNSRGGCYVKIDSDEGVVEKLRDSHGVLYCVNNKELSKVGSQVPEDVSRVVSLGLVNYQFQLEPHFLVLQSGGQIASFINRVLKLNIVGHAISLCTRRIGEKERSKLELKESIDKTVRSLKAYVDLDKLNAIVDRWVDCNTNLEQTGDKLVELQSLLAGIEETDYEVEWLEEYREISSLVTKIDTLLGELEVCEDDVIELEEAIVRIEAIENQLCAERQTVESYSTDLIECINEYESVLKQMKKCPWCGQKLNPEAVRFKRDGLVLQINE